MITDRTPEDVSKFIVYRNIIGNGGSVTNEELEIMLRGSSNNTTLNRIESKTRELANLLNKYQYRVKVDTMTYTNNYKFSDIDVNRTLNNLNNLKNAYFIYNSTPITPGSMYDYQSLNDIEKILVDIENMIENMKLKFRECGTFECGEVNNL